MAFSNSAPRAGARALVAGAVAAAAAVAACSSDKDVRGITAPAAVNAPFMVRYVALGNSITAGFQSNGITDSTQARAFPVLLAQAAGVRFVYPSVLAPGCPAPIVNGLTGVRTTGDTASACTVRASATDLLNNVAVPGANSFDPIGAGVPPTTGTPVVGTVGGYSTLTRLFLGNLTQVQKAVQANPTFATVWIGNNDVLGAALSNAGDSTRATALATFRTNYGAMIDQLRAGSPELQKGILIGVVDVTNAPVLIPVAVFNPNQPGYSAAAFAGVQGLFGVGTRRPATYQIQFDPSCTNSTAAITLPALAGLGAAAPTAGYVFNCGPARAASGSTPALPQTPNLVTDQERAFFVARVAAYNAYIKAKADSIGFLYYDPNVRLAQYRATGAILPFPNLAAPTRPYGPLISNDGVHPGNLVHAQLAKDLRDTINARYGANLADIAVTGVQP